MNRLFTFAMLVIFGFAAGASAGEAASVEPACAKRSQTLKKLEPIWRNWGSSWATIGLAKSLSTKGLDAASVPRGFAAIKGSGADAATGLPKQVVHEASGVRFLVPAGEFLMGSPDNRPDRGKGEQRRHRRVIRKPFYLGATEVTAGQFRRFVQASKYQTDARHGSSRRRTRRAKAHSPCARCPATVSGPPRRVRTTHSRV